MEYYSFIAGLPDIQPDDTKSLINLSSLKADIEENVAENDLKLLDLFFYGFDNQNFMSLLEGQEGKWNELGTVEQEDMEEFISLAKDGKIHQDDHLPPYFAEFITAYQADSPLYAEMSWEDQLTTLYYTNAIESKNRFAKEYFEFNLNLQNILTALTARKHDIDLNKVIIGEGEIAENIKSNTAKDFGIAAMFPHLEEALRIDESKDTLEREQKIDALRWLWLEESTVFNYFTVEKIFAYLLQVEMVERWLKIDLTAGKEDFATYVKELVASVEINITQ